MSLARLPQRPTRPRVGESIRDCPRGASHQQLHLPEAAPASGGPRGMSENRRPVGAKGAAISPGSVRTWPRALRTAGSAFNRPGDRRRR
eukprot:7327680-Pyramimonas_sp.AAC.1